MRGAWLVVPVLAGACGMPEQLLRVVARVQDVSGQWRMDVPVTLESDDGASIEGCGTFAPLQKLDIPLTRSVRFEVLRSETIGPSGEPRCFRLNWSDRSLLAFGPLGHDVGLPPFHVWPAGRDLTADLAAPTPTGMTFVTTPPTYLGRAEDEFDVFPPRHFVEVFDDRGQLAWRVFQGDSTGAMTVTANIVFVNLSSYVLEGRGGTIHGASFRAGRTYVTDSVGRPFEMRFEHRIITNELTVPPPPGGATPLSRGQPCDGFETCPFTDGDFTPVAVNAKRVDLDLQGNPLVTTILVRGLWAGTKTNELRIDYENRNGVLQRIKVPLGDKERNANRNGGYGPGRVDLTLFTSNVMRRAVLSVVDEAGTPVTLERLAEVSFF